MIPSRPIRVVFVVALLLAACGGSDDAAVRQTDAPVAQSGGQESSPAAQGSDEPTPEASGPLAANGMRIGATEWTRTLPMTRGKCFVEKADGALGDKATVWGTLNGNDNMSFSVKYRGVESVEAEVSSDTMFWVAGVRDGTELAVDVDFEANTISGTGLFHNLHTAEWAYGSFEFTCEDEG